MKLKRPKPKWSPFPLHVKTSNILGILRTSCLWSSHSYIVVLALDDKMFCWCFTSFLALFFCCFHLRPQEKATKRHLNGFSLGSVKQHLFLLVQKIWKGMIDICQRQSDSASDCEPGQKRTRQIWIPAESSHRYPFFPADIVTCLATVSADRVHQLHRGLGFSLTILCTHSKSRKVWIMRPRAKRWAPQSAQIPCTKPSQKTSFRKQWSRPNRRGAD